MLADRVRLSSLSSLQGDDKRRIYFRIRGDDDITITDKTNGVVFEEDYGNLVRVFELEVNTIYSIVSYGYFSARLRWNDENLDTSKGSTSNPEKGVSITIVDGEAIELILTEDYETKTPEDVLYFNTGF